MALDICEILPHLDQFYGSGCVWKSSTYKLAVVDMAVCVTLQHIDDILWIWLWVTF